MGLNAAQQREYDDHCAVINQCDENQFHKQRHKKLILKTIKKYGTLDMRAFEPAYRWDICTIRLRRGDFTNWDGWQYRSNWFKTFMGADGERCPIKRWDAFPVNHLVVMGEQGLGDEILFLSVLPDLLVRYGKGIEWVGYKQLNSIVERSFGITTSERRLLSEVTEGDAIMASGELLPWYRRDLSHFPRKPFLKPDPERVSRWQTYLNQFPRPWIGLGWHSRHGFIDPEVLRTTEGTYFDLQYRKDDGPALATPVWCEPCPFDFTDSFEDLFAFVACLHRVVSVTQTLVHIAGSIGTECHAIQPPKNGEVNYPLWYNVCDKLGGRDVWPHIVYGSVTVYGELHAFQKRQRR
jgi:hypothetical protein